MNKSQQLGKLNQRINQQYQKDVKRPFKWRTILALIFMYIAVLSNWEWFMGVLFLFWVVPDIFSGVTFFVEPVERDKHPLLFWIIVISWLLMSFYSISTLFIDYSQWA